MTKETCDTCRFYDAWDDDMGQCRRRAPAAIVVTSNQIDPTQCGAIFPNVQSEVDWCGEHERSDT